MKAVLFLSMSALVASAQANYTATVYEQNSDRKKILYTYTNETTSKDGIDEVHAVYKDPAGNVVMEENSQIKGSHILKVDVDQKQLGQKGLVEVKDGIIHFTKVADGKSSTKEEKLGSTFVMGANFHRFVQDHWKEISKGDSVSFRFGVWDRQETVGFELFKTGDASVGEQKAVLLKMKPSSFIIAALVKPIVFTYAADGSRLLVRNGRVEPKQKDGSTYKDLDAEMVYSF